MEIEVWVAVAVEVTEMVRSTGRKELHCPDNADENPNNFYRDINVKAEVEVDIDMKEQVPNEGSHHRIIITLSQL